MGNRPYLYLHIRSCFHDRGCCSRAETVTRLRCWTGNGRSLILQHLLGQVKEVEDLNAAFMAYDEVRRPRSQSIIYSSRETGLMMCGKAPGTGLDVAKLREALPPRWDFIHHFNLEKHMDDADNAFTRFKDEHHC